AWEGGAPGGGRRGPRGGRAGGGGGGGWGGGAAGGRAPGGGGGGGGAVGARRAARHTVRRCVPCGLRPLDRGVAPADVPDADEAEPAAGQAGPQPPGAAVVVEPAVEGQLPQEEDVPDDGAADDGGAHGSL